MKEKYNNETKIKNKKTDLELKLINKYRTNIQTKLTISAYSRLLRVWKLCKERTNEGTQVRTMSQQFHVYYIIQIIFRED